MPTRIMWSSTRGKDMDQRWRTLGIVLFTAAMFGGAALRSAEAKILAQWVQLGADVAQACGPSRTMLARP